MKHVFLIHSHTLFLTAVGVIEKENIAKEDVIFLYSRNYSNSLPYSFESYNLSKEIEDTYYILFSWSRRNFWFNKKQRDQSVGFFDTFLAEHAPNGFYLYACHLQAFANQIIATNKLCKECFYIQEGGRVMTPDITSRVKWFCRFYNNIILHGEKRIWKMTNWFPNEQTPYSKPITAYAFDQAYFCGVPKETRMVTWPNIRVDIDLHTERPMFLLEGAVELGQIDRRTYMEAVDRLVSMYAKTDNYIKFHPKQSIEIKLEFNKMFERRGLHVEELPMSIPFELIVANFKNLDLYGFGTSLLFYGQAFGHHVTAHEEWLMGSARYRAHVKGLQTLK